MKGGKGEGGKGGRGQGVSPFSVKNFCLTVPENDVEHPLVCH